MSPYSRSLFTLEDDIVVIAPGLVTMLRDDRQVAVTGDVMRFDIPAIEQHVRGYRVDVLPRDTDELRNRPVIIATSIRTDDGQELIGRREQVGARSKPDPPDVHAHERKGRGVKPRPFVSSRGPDGPRDVRLTS